MVLKNQSSELSQGRLILNDLVQKIALLPEEAREQIMGDINRLGVCLAGTEQALQESERLCQEAVASSLSWRERFQILADSNPLLIWMTDSRGGNHYINQTYREFIGVSLEAVQGLNWQNYIHPDDVAEYSKAFLQAISEQKDFRREARVRRADGEWHWLVHYAKPYFSEDRQYLGHVGNSMDITDQIQAEDALRISNEALQKSESFQRALNEIDQAIHSTLDTAEILRRSISAAAEALCCDTAAISLRKDSRWIVSSVYGLPEDILGMEMDDTQEQHAVLAIQSKMPVSVPDAFNDERFNREHLRKWGIRSVLVMPIVVKNEATGVMFFNYQKSAVRFNQAQMDFVSQLAASLSLSLENSRLFRDLQQEIIERKQAEKAFEKALIDVENEKNRLLAVLEALPIGLAIYDKNGADVIANRGYEEVWGNPRPRVHSFDDYPAYQAWWADSGEPVKPEEWASAQALQKGETISGQVIEVQGFDGKHHIILNSGAPIRDAQGQISGAAVALMDITEHRQMEQALAVSERKYRELVEFAPTAIYEVDFRTLHFTAVNDAMSAMTGYSREELLQMSPFDLLDEESQILLHERTRQWQSGEQPEQNVEYKIKARDGHIIYAVLSTTFKADEDGRPLSASVIAHDITERKQAEAALHESESRERARANEMEALMDAAPAVIWISRDPECREMTGNRYSYEFLHIPQGENVSKTARKEAVGVQQYHMERNGRQIPISELPMQIAAATGKPAQDYTFDLIYQDGLVFHMFGNVNPLFDLEGKPYGAIGVFLDLTTLRRLEEEQISTKAEIEVQRRLMDQREQERTMIARDLHDGPIQTLSGSVFHLQMIKEAFPDLALQVELNQIGMNIKNSIHELREVLNDLRPPALMHFGFTRMIRMYTEDLRERFPEIEIEMDVMDDNKILSDEARLALFRIYQAAINNIVRHSGASQAWVIFKLNPDSFLLELRDNGKGFESTGDFAQLTRDGHFGLVGMKERAEAIGGVFTVASQPGQGTTIAVKGPLSGRNVR